MCDGAREAGTRTIEDEPSEDVLKRFDDAMNKAGDLGAEEQWWHFDVAYEDARKILIAALRKRS